MMLTRIPALEGFSTLQERMNRLLEEVWGNGGSTERGWLPTLDVLENPEALLVKVDLPGVDPAKVEITVDGDYLDIRGEKPVQEVPKDGRWYRFERLAGAFHRRVPLPFAVEAGKIEAHAAHGVVTITLPKKSEAQPKRISVKVG